MRLIRGLGGPGSSSAGCALSIGAYDGLHLGHQALLATLAGRASAAGLPAALVTFEPLPREYLSPKDPPARLTSLRERWRLLERSPLAHLWLLRFGEALRTLRAESFAQLLAREGGARIVVVGHDFRFGYRGEGD